MLKFSYEQILTWTAYLAGLFKLHIFNPSPRRILYSVYMLKNTGFYVDNLSI